MIINCKFAIRFDMKELKPLLIILGRFLLTYLVLTIIYSLYLSPYTQTADPITTYVAESAAWLMRLFGFNVELKHVPGENFVRFYLEGKYTSFINEGCNAVSVMIIFVSFIVAFFQKWGNTLLFIFGGLLVLFFSNIIRIGWLNYIFLTQPEFSKTAHDIVFPAIIYGMVLLLWFIWVKFYVLKKVKK